MPVLELEIPTAVTHWRVHGMDIHDAPGHHGISRVVLPDIALIVKSDSLRANICWQGTKMVRHTEWQPGQTAFLPAGSELVSRVDTLFRGTIVRLSPGAFQSAALDLDLRIAELDFTSIFNPQVAHLSSSLISLAQSGVLQTHPTVSEALSTALAAEAAKVLSPSVEKHLAALRGGLSPERKRRVIEYADANLHRQVTLAELAGVANMSLFHFSRSFKQVTGISPVAFLLRRRIQRASHMLRRGVVPISQIALDCGFSSQSHFTTSFKNATGMTPSVFRKAA